MQEKRHAPDLTNEILYCILLCILPRTWLTKLRLGPIFVALFSFSRISNTDHLLIPCLWIYKKIQEKKGREIQTSSNKNMQGGSL